MQTHRWSVLPVDTFGAKHVWVKRSHFLPLVIQRGERGAKGGSERYGLFMTYTCVRLFQRCFSLSDFITHKICRAESTLHNAGSFSLPDRWPGWFRWCLDVPRIGSRGVTHGVLLQKGQRENWEQRESYGKLRRIWFGFLFCCLSSSALILSASTSDNKIKTRQTQRHLN